VGNGFPGLEESVRLGGGAAPMERNEVTLLMEVKPDYLHVDTSGVRSRDTVKKIAMQVFDAALEKRLSKVLVDVRKLNGKFGFTDIHFLVTQVMEELREKGVDQVAVIDIQRTLGQEWFLEIVAQSHGFNFRVFSEEESAVKWLEV
jgi:hypothetical protein